MRAAPGPRVCGSLSAAFRVRLQTRRGWTGTFLLGAGSAARQCERERPLPGPAGPAGAQGSVADYGSLCGGRRDPRGASGVPGSWQEGTVQEGAWGAAQAEDDGVGAAQPRRAQVGGGNSAARSLPPSLPASLWS